MIDQWKREIQVLRDRFLLYLSKKAEHAILAHINYMSKLHYKVVYWRSKSGIEFRLSPKNLSTPYVGIEDRTDRPLEER